MREPNPDGNDDADEDDDEVTEGWQISHADDHAGQFRFDHPDTAARRQPIGQLPDGAKHHHRPRMGRRPTDTALRG
jgi:hypothetical protein